MVRVKICGVTSVADAQAAVAAGALAVGFNFHPSSPRRVAPELARAIARSVPPQIWRVGVFVDRPRRDVEALIEAAGLSVLQFHGSESPAFCRGWRLPVIKAVRVRTQADVVAAKEYAVDFVLADAYVEGAAGGTGTAFNWALLEGMDRSRLILAGGLTPANVGAAVRQVRPYAVDVASGVEREPGKKDPQKVREFITNAQTA